jgi:hypothetical protein
VPTTKGGGHRSRGGELGVPPRQPRGHRGGGETPSGSEPPRDDDDEQEEDVTPAFYNNKILSN